MSACEEMMLMKLIVTILGYFAIEGLAGFTKSFSGPFDVVVKRVDDCEKGGKYPIKLIGNKISRYNRTAHVYSATLVTPMEVNDDVKIWAYLAIFGNGGWKDNYFIANAGGLCCALQTFTPKMVKIVLDKLDSKCPIAPGNYTFKDLVLKMDFNWPAIPYGSYRADLVAKKHGNNVFCKRVFADAVPKSKGN